MNFCPMLYRDINLEPASIQPCCDVHGCLVPVFPFSGDKLDMQAYAAHIENCVRRLQEKGDSLCRGCPQLQDVSAGELKGQHLQFRSVSINAHRYLCNCKCTYCDLWKHRDRGTGYPVLPVLESLHQQNALAPHCFISWGGGEPSILKDFEEASLWLTKKAFWQNVHTNALRFSPAIALLLHEGRGEINISLDSATPATYQKVKGVDGFAAVCQNLSRYVAEAANSKNITLKYIIFEANNSISEITRFFDLCTTLGITSVQYSLEFREVNGNGPSPETLKAAAFFVSRATARRIRCVPFFISPDLQAQIDSLEKRYFTYTWVCRHLQRIWKTPLGALRKKFLDFVGQPRQ